MLWSVIIISVNAIWYDMFYSVDISYSTLLLIFSIRVDQFEPNIFIVI